ncbi:MAG: hypothetical protein D6722_00550 [Bacteroidetes bacterium]|nr:MAG: hypothetical protein D6722_00550 [Bacteroidota bacterium]
MHVFRFASLLLLVVLAGCTSLPEDSLSPAADTALLTASGSWTVTRYEEHNRDETHHYQGYRFSFDAGDVLTVTLPDGSKVTGSWRRGRDDGQEVLDILLAGSKDLEDLSDDWRILQLDDQRIELRDDNVEPEWLTFSR